MAQPGVASVPGASGDPERPPAAAGMPALENGDRLTRCEFERRHAARPDLKEAQLGDLAGALAEVQKGVGTPEHKAFVARLAEQRSSI